MIVQNKLERQCVPISERFLVVERKGSTRNKFTINPIDGRCALKVTDDVSNEDYDRLVEFAELMMKQEVPSITLRGRFDLYRDKWSIQLISELKDVKVSFKYEELKEL